MKKRILQIYFFLLLLLNSFFVQAQVNSLITNDLSSKMEQLLEEAVIKNRQDTLLPYQLAGGLFGEFLKESIALRLEDLDRLTFIYKTDVVVDTINNSYLFFNDTTEVFIFRNRKYSTPPTRFQFYYEARKDSIGQMTIFQRSRINNPITSWFATQLEETDDVYACVIQLFTPINYKEINSFNMFSRHSLNSFYYRLKNGKSYFVDDEMNAFDSFEEFLIHKFGSIENYIQVYKAREKFLQNLYFKNNEFYKNASFDEKFKKTLRSSLLPNE